MTDNPLDLFGPFRPPGAYGTNLGDIWFAADWLQDALANDPKSGPEYRAIVEVLDKDGQIQPAIYVTKNPEMIEHARQGHMKYVAWRAHNN